MEARVRKVLKSLDSKPKAIIASKIDRFVHSFSVLLKILKFLGKTEYETLALMIQA